MEDGLGKVKRVAKRFGDTAAKLETKAEPLLDRLLNRVKESKYSARIILSLILASFAVGWWALS